MDLGLKGKTAVICGGSTGIGAAAALLFAREGCRVAVCSRSEEKLEEFRRNMAEQGFCDVLLRQVDATVKKEIDEFAEYVGREYGGIDIWVNCAGGNKWGPLDQLTEEKYRTIMDLNLTSAFFGIQAAACWMKKRGGGSIINISSQSSRRAVTYRVMYGAAKAAVNVMTEGAAAELAPYHIRVNAVAPGVVATALMKRSIEENPEGICGGIALQRVGEPEEIASLIVSMASDRMGYLTGEVIDMNGGALTVNDPKFAWTTPWDEETMGN